MAYATSLNVAFGTAVQVNAASGNNIVWTDFSDGTFSVLLTPLATSKILLLPIDISAIPSYATIKGFSWQENRSESSIASGRGIKDLHIGLWSAGVRVGTDVADTVNLWPTSASGGDNPVYGGATSLFSAGLSTANARTPGSGAAAGTGFWIAIEATQVGGVSNRTGFLDFTAGFTVYYEIEISDLNLLTDIPNCLSYHKVGVSAETLSSGYVTQWNDTSSNANHATNTDSNTSRPLKITSPVTAYIVGDRSGVDASNGRQTYLDWKSGAHVTSTLNFTHFGVYEIANAQEQVFGDCSGSFLGESVMIPDTGQIASLQGGLYNTGNLRVPCNLSVIGTRGAVGDTTHYLNGQSANTGTLYDAGGSGTGTFFNRTSHSSPLRARARAVIIYNRALTDAEAIAVQSKFILDYGIQVPASSTRLVVYDGDSTVTFLADNNRSMPIRLVDRGALLAATDRIYNFAKSGSTITQCSTRFTTATGAVYDAALANSIVILCCGGNDIFRDGVSAATAYSRVKSYGTTAKSAGYSKVYVRTCFRFVAGGAGAYAIMQAFNQLLRTGDGLGVSYDGVIDTEADPDLGSSGLPSNTTLSADGTHLTDAGFTIEEDYHAAIFVGPAIESVVVGTDGVTFTATVGRGHNVNSVSSSIALSVQVGSKTVTINHSTWISATPSGRTLTIVMPGTGNFPLTVADTPVVNGTSATSGFIVNQFSKNSIAFTGTIINNSEVLAPLIGKNLTYTPTGENKTLLGGNIFQAVIDGNNLREMAMVFKTYGDPILKGIVLGGRAFATYSNNDGSYALGIYLIDDTSVDLVSSDFSLSDLTYVNQGFRFRLYEDSQGRLTNDIAVDSGATAVVYWTVWGGYSIGLNENRSIICKKSTGSFDEIGTVSIGGMPIIIVRIGSHWFLTAKE